MKTVGILGGLGPLAGAHFYRRVIDMTPAAGDREHIPVILISDPAIPSRVEHLSGTGESPVPKLVEVARKLIGAGASLLAIPSSTTSIYEKTIAEQIDVPIVSMIDEVTAAISRSRCSRIGVMGTTPTRMFHVYDEAFERAGIRAVYPDEETQSAMMDVISTVKEATAVNNHPQEGDVNVMTLLGRRTVELAERPWSRGVDGILLACTELPVIFPIPEYAASTTFSGELFNSTDILAAAVVREAYE
ncbi:aspartate/glutamate racemase family protein [Alicyclobacillus dauci]|uniref:Amino acid racemase n=1 Tax=Alicyclobacillus dauci TaxID=1475485 RepID=A0ABY6Z4G3_9BACL|nr:amino acid racemase [Alicyclobacillus dauci]WAH37645.1 amino acid racemase [Alicyclobacillus dauci]